jgi:hypothetical protein
MVLKRIGFDIIRRAGLFHDLPDCAAGRGQADAAGTCQGKQKK